jgi:hypothetical protein
LLSVCFPETFVCFPETLSIGIKDEGHLIDFKKKENNPLIKAAFPWKLLNFNLILQ